MKISIGKSLLEAAYWRGASVAVESLSAAKDEESRMAFLQKELDLLLDGIDERIEIVEDL